MTRPAWYDIEMRGRKREQCPDGGGYADCTTFGPGGIQNGDGLFLGLYDFAIFDERLYVSDENDRMQVFDLDGNFLEKWGSNGMGPDKFLEPRGVAINSQNQILIADQNGHRIQVYLDSELGDPDTRCFDEDAEKNNNDFYNKGVVLFQYVGDIYTKKALDCFYEFTDRANPSERKYAGVFHNIGNLEDDLGNGDKSLFGFNNYILNKNPDDIDSGIDIIANIDEIDQKYHLDLHSPGSVSVFNGEMISEKSNVLKWSPPINDGGTPVLHYDIKVKKDNGDYQTLESEIHFSQDEYVHQGISPKSKYSYQITPVNAIGTGETSETVISGIEILVERDSKNTDSANFQVYADSKIELKFGLSENSLADVKFTFNHDDNLTGNFEFDEATNSEMFEWTPNSQRVRDEPYAITIYAKNGNETIASKSVQIIVDPPLFHDIDKDGISDDVDDCPTEPETFNRFEDVDGCPDKEKFDKYIEDLISTSGDPEIKKQLEELHVKLNEQSLQIGTLLEDNVLLQSSLNVTAADLSLAEQQRDRFERNLAIANDRLQDLNMELESISIQNESFKTSLEDAQNSLEGANQTISD